MNTPNIFPFKVYAHERYDCTISPEFAERLWMRDRDTAMKAMKAMGIDSWYALDLEVQDANTVLIHVHDMANNFSGGIGKIVGTYKPDLKPGDTKELAALLKERQLDFAEREYAAREATRLADAIEQVRKEMFGE